MKRLIIILVTGIFCCNIVIAKELKTRFGFNINLPDNYVPVQDGNFDDLMDHYEGEEINIDLINNLRTQTQNVNVDFEYYFPVDLNPALNNLNLVVQKGENIVKAKKVGTSKLCPFYKTLYTNMFQQEIGQYHCKFLNGFAPKFKTVMYLNHDGAYPNTRMIQFIFQAPPGLTVFTALCQSKNCNVVQKQLIGIILSVK